MNDAQNADVLSRAKRVCLYSFVVFLAISALLAITSVLSGKLGDFEIKVLVTTSVIAGASICALCCGMYVSRRQDPLPGIVGASLAGLAAAMLILGVWTEMHSKAYWKTTLILSVFAIAFAHSLALLAVRLRPAHSWLQKASTATIFALAALLSFVILYQLGDNDTLKLVAILAILVALATLVIPIMARLAKGAPTPVGETPSGSVGETLSLTKREDGMYQDRHGRLYEVKEVSNAAGQTTPNDAPVG